MPQHAPDIQTLLLDADGVIQISSSGFLEDLRALCPDAAQSERFLEDVFASEKPCLTGEAHFPDALERVLRTWAVDVVLADALELWTRIEPSPGMLDIVSSLRAKGIRVCLATNQQAHRASIMADHLGYAPLFDQLFFSFELGVAKPSPDFFLAILKQLPANPDNILFVDDHAQNVAAAESTGIAGALYHVDHGLDSFTSILERHGLPV